VTKKFSPPYFYHITRIFNNFYLSLLERRHPDGNGAKATSKLRFLEASKEKDKFERFSNACRQG